MLKRFFEILKPLRKAMVDWDLDISISQEDVGLVKLLCQTLEPVELHGDKKVSERETTNGFSSVTLTYIAIEFAAVV